MNKEELLQMIEQAAKEEWTELDLSAKGLTTLPPEIGRLNNLTHLNIGNPWGTEDRDRNQLTELPLEIGQLTNLTALDLSDNQLTGLPSEIVQLTNLRELFLLGNKLTVLPSEIVQLINLTRLNVNYNQLTALPSGIVQLTNLTRLDLSYNQLTEVPSEIVQLTNLRGLHLRSNKLTVLPSEIGQLASLTQLNLIGNQLMSLPESIGQLTSLGQLYLRHNQLTSLPEPIGELTNLQTLDPRNNRLTSLPESIGQLANLQALNLRGNQLTSLPESIGQLASLQSLDLIGNQLTSLPESIGQLANLTQLSLRRNQLMSLPESIGQLANLGRLDLRDNQVTPLPASIGQLTNLTQLNLIGNQLMSLPESIGQLTNLSQLYLRDNQLTSLPESIGQLASLTQLNLIGNQLMSLPESIGQLTSLGQLYLRHNQLTSLPEPIGELTNLQLLDLIGNQLTSLPPSLARLKKLESLSLEDNQLDPVLQSAYEAGLDELLAYLRSLEDLTRREELYEAKLILVGEGGVGKTTLLKAMTGREPREGEPTTHGVNIDIQSLRLPHPDKEGIEIRLNAWDFCGQEVCRVTHQFFFSRRSVYLLVWEPRRGVQQCQVEDWLKLIRLRVGNDARVIIVSTHCRTGERIARIDKPVLMRDFGPMIVGFHEVDSLVPDPETGEMVGVAQLKELIAETAKDLEQMGMEFNRDWREARDELLAMDKPRIAYPEFAVVCDRHGLDAIATKTLADLMHDLGYIVYYAEDERLKDDVVLQPEWLTKAISFVLEDWTTQEMDGILPDSRLKKVWLDHPFKGEPRYQPSIYPFFLRLMEKYDVSYRLEEGNASLVAQHVPQVRPDLPWLPEEEPAPDRRRIAMVCVMDEAPPGLAPWMIVRTHEYAYQCPGPNGKTHRLHWQKGMFLRNKRHGEAILELRERELHAYAEAVWPEYFMNVLRKTLHKLITDNWPGLEGRYYFGVPCPERSNGRACDGRFDIDALRQFLEEGDETIRCQVCRKRQNIVELLYGFVEEDLGQQLRSIEARLEGLESRIANYVMAIMHAMANEAKQGPRLFTVEPVGGWRRFLPQRLVAERFRLHLWCEAEGCQHPVLAEGKGVYEFDATREWVLRIAPYANFVAGVLKTLLPVAGPAVNVVFGPKTAEKWAIKDHLDLMKEATGTLLEGDLEVSDRSRLREGVLSEAERSGLLALHAFLRKEDPNHERLGLMRVPTYTGDFLWLCPTHYLQIQPQIPEKIE